MVAFANQVFDEIKTRADCSQMRVSIKAHFQRKIISDKVVDLRTQFQSNCCVIGR